MGLLRKLLLAPLTGPAHGAFWVIEKIHEAAEAELTDPVQIKATLRAAEIQLEQGEITEEAFEELEDILLDRLRRAAA